MPIFSVDAKAIRTVILDGKKVKVLAKEEYEKFNPSVLGLGDIGNRSKAKEAIAAVFDLHGFTNFCKQIEPQLSVPFYLSSFLNWIFAAIRKETSAGTVVEGVRLWHRLPYLVKFMGDGLLVIWDTDRMHETSQHNLIISLFAICREYKKKFLVEMKRKVYELPNFLRCGVAKGAIYSIGDGNDFVGPCINFAARLQRLDGITFAFSRRGFNPEESWSSKTLSNWILRKVQIRGMGEGELIYIRNSEFAAMQKDDKAKYKNP